MLTVNGERLTGDGVERGVFAYLTAPADTTVTTSGTYYPIVGTFTNSPQESFTTVADPAIQYTNVTTKIFEIDWHADCAAVTNGRTVNVGIKHNGTLVDSSVMSTYLKTGGEAQALSGTTVVTLAKDGKIQLVLTADNDGEVITVNSFTTTIREFF